MPAPTLIAKYAAGYVGTSTPQNTAIATQAGDLVIVLVQGASASLSITAVGDGIDLTEIFTNNAGADPTISIWQAYDNSGSGSMNIECDASGESIVWGFTVLVVRGATSTLNTVSGNGDSFSQVSLDLETTAANSAVITLVSDSAGNQPYSYSWNETDGYTPTTGNGGVLVAASVEGYYAFYGAFYEDLATAGEYNFSMDPMGGMFWAGVALEVMGQSSDGGSAQTAWLTA